MPLYEYECKKCHHRFEKIQKFSDRMVKKCPDCGGPVEQMISAPAVQFKGSGWYVTDYAKKSSSRNPAPKTPKTRSLKTSPGQRVPSQTAQSRTARSRKVRSRRLPRNKAPPGNTRRREATGRNSGGPIFAFSAGSAVTPLPRCSSTSTRAQSDPQSCETDVPAPLCRQCCESYSGRSSDGTACPP
jgi:putative FmdB family regulatory protein